MSTRHIVAAIASVTILVSTIIIFQTSSRPRIRQTVTSAAGPVNDARPVHELEPVVVYASPLPRDTVAHLGTPDANARSGFALPSLDNTSLRTNSPLFMPYYSFANNIQTIIKD